MTRKLTTIIVISFVTVFAIFITGISLMSYKIFFDFTSDEISATRLTLLNQSTEKVSSFNSSVSEAAIYIAVNRNVIETFSSEVSSDYEAIVEQRDLTELMTDVVSLKREIDSIELYTDRYDRSPKINESSVFSLDILKQQSWFNLFDTMDHGWIPQHISPLNEYEVISYVHRLVNDRGQTVGYVKVNVRSDTFFAHMEDADFFNPAEEPLLLLNTGGRIIAQSNIPEHMEILQEIITPVASEPFLRLNDHYDHLSNHHQVLRHGNEVYLLLISKPNYDRWQLVHLIPVDTLYAKTRELGWFVLLLGLCGLLLSVPLAYWVGKKIIDPIRIIIKGMRQVEKGKFDVRIAPHYIEEYNMLAHNFNHMISELDQSLLQLKAENRARRDAELRTLQNQITPHFLYNTLDIIHWKAMDHQAEDISRMVNQLSKMFRIGLSKGQNFIMIRDELEHAKCYIQIQEDRLSQKIDYDVKVPAAMKSYYVPKIILQPFIENSMRHGYPDDHNDPIHIQVSSKMMTLHNENCLEINIFDNGVGLPEDWEISNSKGIGIKNVEERIRMYCGWPYGIEISNQQNTKGVKVKIMLPLIQNSAELEAWLEKEREWFDGN